MTSAHISVYTYFETGQNAATPSDSSGDANRGKRRGAKAMADDPKFTMLDDARCKAIGRSCACYNLRRAARATTRLYDEMLKPSGLRATQFSVLVAAKLRGPVTVAKLADLTVTERTTLTRNLTVLKNKGLIRIEPGSDRREHLVSITEAGVEALMAAEPLWEKAQAHIANGLGENRLGGVLKDLSEIISLTRTT